MKLRRLLRTEYLRQPAQLGRRAWRQLRIRPGQPAALVRLPWGFPLAVCPRDSIGRAIIALNVLDLTVTESIWRLLDPGETVADIGANIGHMTSVMAARLRRGGTIHSFEPLPRLAAALAANIARWQTLTTAAIQLHPSALAEREAMAPLHLPRDFELNQGTASLDTALGRFGPPFEFVSVPCRRLDDIAGPDIRFGVIKVDVEGCEAQVLRGATRLLSAGRIRDIIFEEHRGAGAESIACLRDYGYQVHRVIRHRTGPRLVAPEIPDPGEIDPPTFLATRDPARVAARFAPGGWQCLD